jgi:hypothetical protein
MITSDFLEVVADPGRAQTTIIQAERELRTVTPRHLQPYLLITEDGANSTPPSQRLLVDVT